ncbi:MAG TPA: right-handed parallel beta-helix repeat-containing protein, partial [Candidatus Dormibacteraeota bacterium]|nr:right-handed parallel beta-helix repeat-containing protein [Candidatus Dormibacteraeota bacterium]
HQQNLVGIFGAKDLQIEGTGAAPSDVIFDAQFQKLNVIRADRTNGIYLRNFTAQRSTFNAVYVIETDGFVIDHVVGRWDNEYGFLSFAADHGLITNCEAYGNGDSGIYPGGTSDINRGRGFDVPRYAIEVTGCRSHDNALGYSGTGGDSVWVHNNEFDHNSTGASMDSLFPNHPGLPQNHALFEHNLIHGNNSNYYPQVIDGTCARSFQLRGIEKGVVCPSVGVPVGAGVLVIGGNYDVFRENWVYDNWKVGFVQTWVPALVRNDFRPSVQEQTSNFDRYIDNHMGSDLRGDAHPNGLDFFWDGQGTGSCWQTIHSAGTDPLSLPACSTGAPGRILSDPSKLVMFFDCANYDLPTQTLPLGCDWFDTPQRPGVLAVSFTAEAVAPVIQLLAVLLLFSWMVRRRTRLDALDVATAGAAVLAAVLLLVASIEQYWYLAPPGIALLGIAWIAAARLAPTQRLAVLSVLLGVAALMESIDSAILQLPVLIGPVWARLVLEAAWIVWTVVALNTVPPRPIGDAGLGLRSEPSRAGIIATKN